MCFLKKLPTISFFLYWYHLCLAFETTEIVKNLPYLNWIKNQLWTVWICWYTKSSNEHIYDQVSWNYEVQDIWQLIIFLEIKIECSLLGSQVQPYLAEQFKPQCNLEALTLKAVAEHRLLISPSGHDCCLCFNVGTLAGSKDFFLGFMTDLFTTFPGFRKSFDV